MPIDATCPQCGAALEAPDELAGAKGTCPKCRTVLDVPHRQTPERPVEKAAPKPKRLLAKCPGCGQQVGFTEARKGASVNCPKCKEPFTLPESE